MPNSNVCLSITNRGSYAGTRPSSVVSNCRSSDITADNSAGEQISVLFWRIELFPSRRGQRESTKILAIHLLP